MKKYIRLLIASAALCTAPLASLKPADAECDTTVSIIESMVDLHKMVTVKPEGMSAEEAKALTKATNESLQQVCRTAKHIASQGMTDATQVATALESKHGDDPIMMTVVRFLRGKPEETVPA